MPFAQLTYQSSLRDIETRLPLGGGKLYHMGFRASVARSTHRHALKPDGDSVILSSRPRCIPTPCSARAISMPKLTGCIRRSRLGSRGVVLSVKEQKIGSPNALRLFPILT